MDFLLECAGFPPETNQEELVQLLREQGETVSWRGRGGDHLRLRLGSSLELRADRYDGEEHWTLLPYFSAAPRLRVAVLSLRKMEDSPLDALLRGWAAPTRPGEDEAWQTPGAYQLAAWLTDARRIPKGLLPGQVLAVGVAGFALEVNFLGPNAETRDKSLFELPRGARLAPLGGPDDPAACMQVSGRIMRVRRLQNPVSGEVVRLIEIDAPERPVFLFVSPWQLMDDGMEEPRPGWRIEGVFLFLGQITGGLPGPARRKRRLFG